MRRRHLITALVTAPVLSLMGACGSDAAGDTVQTSDTTGTTIEPAAEPDTTPVVESTTVPVTEPPVTQAPSTDASTDVSTEASSDELVLSYTTPGGFTTQEFAFQQPPIALLTADGTLIGPATVSDGAAPPLSPQHQMQTVSPAGIEALLAAAESAGLFADIDYTSEDTLLIADAPTSVLTLTADGMTYAHEAYALGIGGGPGEGSEESTPERQALLDFLMTLEADPASIIGAENLGDPEQWAPDAVQIQVAERGEEDLPAGTPVEKWPESAGVSLFDERFAELGSCVEVDDPDTVALLTRSEATTVFSPTGDSTDLAIVTARPAYPGRGCEA